MGGGSGAAAAAAAHTRARVTHTGVTILTGVGGWCSKSACKIVEVTFSSTHNATHTHTLQDTHTVKMLL